MNEKLCNDLFNFYRVVFRVAVSNKTLEQARDYFNEYVKSHFTDQYLGVAVHELWTAVSGIRDLLCSMATLSAIFTTNNAD